MRFSKVLCVLAAAAACLTMSSCDPDQTGLLEEESASFTETAAAEPSPSAAYEPSVTRAPASVSVAPASPSAELPSPEVSSIPWTPSPVPSALEGDVTGLTVMDVTGDGVEDVLIFDPARTGPTGALLVTLNGTDYETTVPAGGTEYQAYLCSLWADSPSKQLIVVREADGRHDLFLFGFDISGMRAADFTYTIPRELSDSYEEQEAQGAPSLLYGGIDPIVIMGDGSFAVLGYGSSFRRYEADEDFHVTETGPLPLGLLSGVTAAPV